MSDILQFLDFLLSNEETSKDLLKGTGLGFILFLMYLELSPKLGNVWYRYSSEGKRTIQPESALNFLKQPFKDRLFWKPENWDLNFITFSGLVGLGYVLGMGAYKYHTM